MKTGETGNRKAVVDL